MFDRRNTRQTCNVAGIKAAAAGGDLLLQKVYIYIYKPKNMTTNGIKA